MSEDKKTIIKIYEEYVSQNNKPTKEYVQLKEEFETILNDLIKNDLKGNGTKIEKLCDCLLKMNKEQETNAFVEGYTLGTNLTTEAIYRRMK